MALKILSVDDSKMIHTVIGKAFKNYNAELFFANNGVEGLAMASRENPDLIILDVTMPVMDGVETLSKLKADPALKDIPVIMLTAEAGRENVLKIAKMGIRDYVIKPFTEQLIVERVGRVVDLQPRGTDTDRVKSFDDPAHILVVEDKPAIIEQIKESIAASGAPWRVTGVSQCGEAIDATSREIPDVIMVSLSLHERAAFNFFQMMRANARTKSVPVFGLSVKTAVEEQSQAQAIGFNGIITKPIDTAEMVNRLTRAMNLDTSKRYFFIEGTVQHVKIPNNPTNVISSEFTGYIQPKLREMVDAGLVKMVIDASAVEKIEMGVIRLILQVIQASKDLGVKYRLVGNPGFASQAKSFEETKDLEVYANQDAALQSF